MKTVTLLAMGCALVVGCSSGTFVESPTPAPALSAPDQNGKMVSLKEATSGPWALVFFYPEADTPGWIKQTKVLRDADADLDAKGVRVLGVSTDPVAKQLAFARKYQLPMELLSDEDAAICKAFGVGMDEKGKAKRETFMFRNGKMIWHDPKVYPADQARSAFRVIRQVEKDEAAAEAALAGAS